MAVKKKTVRRGTGFLVLTLLLSSFVLRAAGAEITLSVPSGETTLSAALAACDPALSVDDLNGGDLATCDVVKTGEGVLVFDTSLAEWTGNLGVSNGVVRAMVVAQAVLGSAAQGAVHVADGATLVIDDSTAVSTADQNSRAPHRPIRIAGSGADGYCGALQLVNSAKNGLRACIPYEIILEGDATVALYANNEAFVWDSGDSGTGRRIDQQGKYTLTFASAGSATVPRIYWRSTGGVFADPYNVIHDGVHFLNHTALFNGDDSDVVTLRNGAQMYFADCVNQTWSLVFENSAAKTLQATDVGTKTVTDTKRVWAGPVTLGRTLDVKFSSGATTNSLGFAGKVGGTGGLTGKAKAGDDVWFFLLNGENDFTGGIAFTNINLFAGAGGAVPASAGSGALNLVDSDVVLGSAVTDFSFPDVVFEGSGVITGRTDVAVRGTVKSLRKTGAGTLSVNAVIDIGELVLEEGALHLCATRSADAGLHTGYMTVPSADAYQNVLEDEDYRFTMTNSTVTSMEEYAHVSVYPESSDADTWGSSSVDTFWNARVRRYTTYDGYIWNDSPTSETWTVVCTLNYYNCMTVNGIDYAMTAVDGRFFGGNDGTYPDGNAVGALWNVILAPGPNMFRLRNYNRWNIPQCWYGNVCTNLTASQPFENWQDGFGLMVDKLGRGTTDIDNYSRLEDPGDGSLFTTVASSPHTISSLKISGGSLDAGALGAVVNALEGLPAVDGNVTVTGTWKVSAEQLLSSSKASGVTFTDGVIFDMEADELKSLPASADGTVLAETWFGSVPSVSSSVKAARWRLKEADGAIVLSRVPAMTIVVR